MSYAFKYFSCFYFYFGIDIAVYLQSVSILLTYNPGYSCPVLVTSPNIPHATKQQKYSSRHHKPQPNHRSSDVKRLTTKG